MVPLLARRVEKMLITLPLADQPWKLNRSMLGHPVRKRMSAITWCGTHLQYEHRVQRMRSS